MTVFEHLGELRRRLVISIVAVVVGGHDRVHLRPRDHQLPGRRSTTTRHQGDARTSSSSPARSTPSPPGSRSRPTAASCSRCPVWLCQLWRFITPGLNPKEKKYAIPFVALVDHPVRRWAAVVALLTLEPALEVPAQHRRLRPPAAAHRRQVHLARLADDRGVRAVVRVPGDPGVPAARPGAHHRSSCARGGGTRS